MAKRRKVATSATQSPQMLLLLCLVGLVLSYALITRAIDTGSLWQYGLAILVAIISIRKLVAAFKLLKNATS